MSFCTELLTKAVFKQTFVLRVKTQPFPFIWMREVSWRRRGLSGGGHPKRHCIVWQKSWTWFSFCRDVKSSGKVLVGQSHTCKPVPSAGSYFTVSPVHETAHLTKAALCVVLTQGKCLPNTCLRKFRCTECRSSKVDGFSINKDRQPIKSKPPFSNVNKAKQSNQAG